LKFSKAAPATFTTGAASIAPDHAGQYRKFCSHVFSNIAGFGQCGRVSDAKWNIENFRQCFGEQSLARPGWANEENIAFLDFDIGKRIGWKAADESVGALACMTRLKWLWTATERVFFAMSCPTTLLVEGSANFRRFGDPNSRRLPRRLRSVPCRGCFCKH